MWIVRETSCLLLLVVFCLIFIGLGDSHLVIPFLFSLVLFTLVTTFLFFSFIPGTFLLFCAPFA